MRSFNICESKKTGEFATLDLFTGETEFWRVIACFNTEKARNRAFDMIMDTLYPDAIRKLTREEYKAYRHLWREAGSDKGNGSQSAFDMLDEYDIWKDEKLAIMLKIRETFPISGYRPTAVKEKLQQYVLNKGYEFEYDEKFNFMRIRNPRNYTLILSQVPGDSIRMSVKDWYMNLCNHHYAFEVVHGDRFEFEFEHRAKVWNAFRFLSKTAEYFGIPMYRG